MFLLSQDKMILMEFSRIRIVENSVKTGEKRRGFSVEDVYEARYVLQASGSASAGSPEWTDMAEYSTRKRAQEEMMRITDSLKAHDINVYELYGN
ncbi:MAG: hypothetical protein IIY55_06370 [Blautia sp.]|nr:hypothetical protein [Blautia sp.]